MATGGRSRDPIERKTERLIDALKESSDTKWPTSQDLLRSDRDPLKDLLISLGQLYFDVLVAEVEARIQTHKELLCGSPSLDIHYQNLVDSNQPQPSRTRDVLTDMLTRVCHIMATESPLFAFRPVGVGSHRDGTRTVESDLDFVLVSLYRPREDSMERSSEDSMDRSSEDSMERSSEDSMERSSEDSMERSSEDSMERSSEDSPDRPGEDYRVSGGLSFASIVPVVGSVFHKRCEERGLLQSDGRLDKSKYTDQLRVQLSSVMSAVCSELGLSCGGRNRPHFGGFEENGPAWNVVVDGVSVDITPAFTAPRDIKDEEGRKVMEVIAERVSSAVSSTVSSTVSEDQRSDWVNMGLVMFIDIFGCHLSTSLIETSIIRTVPQLQSALKICKVCRDQFFDLPGPDLRPFFRHLEGRVLEWLVSGGCDTLLEAVPSDTLLRAVPSDPDKKVVDELKDHSKVLLLLATQRRPLTLDEDILQKLEEIKRRIDGKWGGYADVDPCLKSLVVNKSPKPIGKTISFVFKCLLLDKWLEENRITTERQVEHVMKEYRRQVKEYSELVEIEFALKEQNSERVEENSELLKDGFANIYVRHPFLWSAMNVVHVFKFSSFYNEEFPHSLPFRVTYVYMIQEILSQITPHTPTPPVSDPPTPPVSDPPTPPVSDPPTPPVSDPPTPPVSDPPTPPVSDPPKTSSH